MAKPELHIRENVDTYSDRVAHGQKSERASSFSLLPKNKFFQTNGLIVEHEIRTGRTFTFVSEVDLTSIERLRASYPARKPSYTAFVAKAVALALLEHPVANRRVVRWPLLPFFGKRLQQFHQCDIAVAMERSIPDAEGVALVDVLRSADELTLGEITDWLRQLAKSDPSSNPQMRDFDRIVSLLPSWLAALVIRIPALVPRLWTRHRGGAVLISSPAKYGVDGAIGTWPWPVGVSFGLVKKRPIVKGDEIVAAPTFNLSLNFDRRIMAGGPAARFFHAIVERLESAEEYLADPQIPRA